MATTQTKNIDKNPTPPASPVKLVFIHHFVGGHWLAHDNGGLVSELNKNNYYVNDITYGWEPASLTDTLTKKKTSLFREITQLNCVQSHIKLRDLAGIVENGLYTEPELRKELSELVRQNFLAYSPVTVEYTLQGRSMEHGLSMFIKVMNAPKHEKTPAK